jgi:hypothetical protein
MTIMATSPAHTEEFSELEELRAQYVACSYLATACQDALGRFPTPTCDEEVDRIARRAFEFLLAVEWDWRVTLRELAEKVARATSVSKCTIVDAGDMFQPRADAANEAEAVSSNLEPVTYIHGSDPARESAPRHRTDYRRRPSVRRRL